MVEGYRISCDIENMNLTVIHGFLSQSYWSSGIPLATLRNAMSNSLCFGVFSNSGEQVGFARTITDKATFAYLADVFILLEHQGKGLAKWLMQSILEHPDLQDLRRTVLATRDAHTLYEQFGFQALANPNTFMEIWRPDIYAK
ncbi:acetyltransferase (GNAT) family protein [Alteromonadaceae bacterium 2753L.S.0a.02]|nr:acetyltransferase (GNAT) family protein [Alteromonadaceae bacterium 2753L.S.0a.02]